MVNERCTLRPVNLNPNDPPPRCRASELPPPNHAGEAAPAAGWYSAVVHPTLCNRSALACPGSDSCSVALKTLWGEHFLQGIS